MHKSAAGRVQAIRIDEAASVLAHEFRNKGVITKAGSKYAFARDKDGDTVYIAEEDLPPKLWAGMSVDYVKTMTDKGYRGLQARVKHFVVRIPSPFPIYLAPTNSIDKVASTCLNWFGGNVLDVSWRETDVSIVFSTEEEARRAVDAFGIGNVED